MYTVDYSTIIASSIETNVPHQSKILIIGETGQEESI